MEGRKGKEKYVVKALQAVCHGPGLFQNCCLTCCLTGEHHGAGADAQSMARSHDTIIGLGKSGCIQSFEQEPPGTPAHAVR